MRMELEQQEKDWKKMTEEKSAKVNESQIDFLKPCPFCGGNVELRSKMDGRDETYFILCMKCYMWFEKFTYRAKSPKTIIEEWNSRVCE